MCWSVPWCTNNRGKPRVWTSALLSVTVIVYKLCARGKKAWLKSEDRQKGLKSVFGSSSASQFLWQDEANSALGSVVQAQPDPTGGPSIASPQDGASSLHTAGCLQPILSRSGRLWGWASFNRTPSADFVSRFQEIFVDWLGQKCPLYRRELIFCIVRMYFRLIATTVFKGGIPFHVCLFP